MLEVASRIAALREPVSATDDRHARLGGYYLRQNHTLIQRHVESISLSLDHTAHWRLRIDIELPTDAEARCRGRGDRCLFLFPLAYLGKSDGRFRFEIRSEDDSLIAVPTRPECDRISGIAAAEAGHWLIDAMSRRPSRMPLEQLTNILRGIPAASPFAAAQIFDRLRRGLELKGRPRPRYLRGSVPPLEPRSEPVAREDGERRAPEIGAAWEEAGLADVLRLFVEHSLVWIPIWGVPGERRGYTVSRQIALERQPFLRWGFGSLDEHGSRSALSSRSGLKTGGKEYGRRAYRFTWAALGERIGQPLAWMPIEYDFPTVHTRRCGSYHFELVCPTGLSPRDLKVATGGPIDEDDERRREQSGPAMAQPPAERELQPQEATLGRTKLTPTIAHHYLPGSDSTGDLWFRTTIGVGVGAMPIFWWLTGALTAAMLWIFAATRPELSGAEEQIAAGVFLVVPALVAALAVGGESTLVPRLIGGARVLLLAIGLSAVMAATVLLGFAPFGVRTSWAVCAIVATVATLPLATSWVLTSSYIWRQLKKLEKARWQFAALRTVIGMAALPIIAMTFMGNAEIARATISVYLLVLAVALTALANNRAAMPIGHNRSYVAVSMLIAAISCTALACTELRGVIDDPTDLQLWLERAALAVLFLSPFAGPLLARRGRRFKPTSDEVHVSPQVGRELIAKERVLELNELLDRRWQLDLQSTHSKHVS